MVPGLDESADATIHLHHRRSSCSLPRGHGNCRSSPRWEKKIVVGWQTVGGHGGIIEKRGAVARSSRLRRYFVAPRLCILDVYCLPQMGTTSSSTTTFYFIDMQPLEPQPPRCLSRLGFVGQPPASWAPIPQPIAFGARYLSSNSSLADAVDHIDGVMAHSLNIRRARPLTILPTDNARHRTLGRPNIFDVVEI